MTAALSSELVERVISRHPLAVADAVAALVATDGLHERRDRVVEVFRAQLRLATAVALAVRIQRGAPPAPESPQVAELLRSVRMRGLTDGQWLALARELLRPWASAPSTHPVPALVELFHGRKHVLRELDGLLEMRKAETVAHGATGDPGELEAVLDKRVPQLEALLSAFDPAWEAVRLVVPLRAPESDAERQRAWALMGDTPSRGRWQRVELAAGARLPAGEVALVDRDGQPRVALHPVLLFRKPSPDAVEELFFFDGTKKRDAIYVALPSMAEHRAADVLATLDRTLWSPEGAESSEDEETQGRPYRGLESFGPDQASLFFGRDAQAEALANRIRRHGWVTVTGASGSGKTSLIDAGVLPRLGEFVTVRLRPGADPLASLAHRLEALGAGAGGANAAALEGGAVGTNAAAHGAGAGGTNAAALVTAAREDPIAFARSARALATDQRLLVRVDQAEELFTLGVSPEAREAFGRALAALVADAEGPARVVLSVREDFFTRLASIPSLRELYARQVEVVATPERAQLIETLVRPAERFGYTFEDDKLVAAIVDPVAQEPAALALVQFTADKLWETRDRSWKRLTWDGYRAVGQVEGALAAHADATLRSLPPAQQALSKALLLRLVTSEGTRSVVLRDELIAAGGPDAAAVLERWIASRLVTAREIERPGGGAAVAVELVHEALIRHWTRLRTWLEEDEERIRGHARVAEASRRWLAEGKSRDYLLSGDRPLLQAAALLDDGALSEDEAQFVRASLLRSRVTRFLGRVAVVFLAWLSAFILVDKAVQYAGLSFLAADLIKIGLGVVLAVVMGVIIVRAVVEFRK